MSTAMLKRVLDFRSLILPISKLQVRNVWVPVYKPVPGVNGNYFRRVIHWKDEYTVEPLETTHLGGRDPETGRVAAKKLGGGVKWKYHWVYWIRSGPADLDEKPKEEKVLDVFRCMCRTADIALVAYGKELKYYLATQNMKPGDIIRTHCGIPRIPVTPNEGDSYPLGALPVGTLVHCVEKEPGQGGVYVHSAGTSATILRKDGDDRVVIKVPSKREFSIDKHCMATVGRLSNVLHGETHIGSVQRNRELGNRPATGLWHRKTGKDGRKIKPPRPVQKIAPKGEKGYYEMRLNMSEYPPPKGKEVGRYTCVNGGGN